MSMAPSCLGETTLMRPLKFTGSTAGSCAPSFAHGLKVFGLAIVTQVSSALGAVQPEVGFGLPRDVSQNGHLIDWLMNITHVFNVILFVIMCVWMAIAILKYNQNHPA